MKIFFRKTFISLLALFLTFMNLQITTAQAAIVNTDQVIDQMIEIQQTEMEREKLIAFINRADVEKELKTQGVSADEAKERIAHLSDAELQMLAGKIDELPAGGIIGTLVGAGVFIFVVLLITDLLGFTDVFPFAHSHAH